MNYAAPSYLLLAVWVAVATVAVTTGDYVLALLGSTVVLFAVANIVTMRSQTLSLAAKDQHIDAQQRHINFQQRHIETLNRQLAAQPIILTKKEDPRL